MKGDNNTS